MNKKVKSYASTAPPFFNIFLSFKFGDGIPFKKAVNCKVKQKNLGLLFLGGGGAFAEAWQESQFSCSCKICGKAFVGVSEADVQVCPISEFSFFGIQGQEQPISSSLSMSNFTVKLRVPG